MQLNTGLKVSDFVLQGYEEVKETLNTRLKVSDFVLQGDEEVKEAVKHCTRPKVSEFVLQGDEEEAVCPVLTTLSMVRGLSRMPSRE